MEMHQIRYFLAAADERNLTKAAKRCNVSPPSLLRAVRLLVHEFGGRLFNRERAQMHLTELGRIALPHLQQIVQDAEEAKAKAKKLLKIAAGSLKPGIMCTITPIQFVGVITNFCKPYPNVKLELLDASAVRLQAMLFAGDLKVAIYALPGARDHKRVHTRPLFREQMVIALPSKHPLAKGHPIRAVDLQGEPYLDRMNCEFTGVADQAFADRGITGPTVHRSDRDDWILAMIAAGEGYGVMPLSNANHSGVIAQPLTEPKFWRTVNLATVRGRQHSPVAGAFVRAVMPEKWQRNDVSNIKGGGALAGLTTNNAELISGRTIAAGYQIGTQSIFLNHLASKSLSPGERMRAARVNSTKGESHD